jgi:hypothetical protein
LVSIGLVLSEEKIFEKVTAASDKVYQLLAHGQWFSPGTSASSTTKSGRHDIAEILLKVALKHQKSIKSNHHFNGRSNLQSRGRTHAVLVIGLYELLDPTT